MKFKAAIIFLLCWVMGTAIATTTSDPVAMLQGVSNQLIASLKAQDTQVKQNPQLVYPIVNRILIPHADLSYMAQRATNGLWGKSTAAQQKAFLQAFTNYMIGTYSAALTSYNNETVQFAPVRGGYQGNPPMVQVDSQIVRPSGPPIAVSYRLMLTGQRWMVYDLIVEGVSLLDSVSSQLSDQIAQGATIDNLTQTLNSHNQAVQQQS